MPEEPLVSPPAATTADGTTAPATSAGNSSLSKSTSSPKHRKKSKGKAGGKASDELLVPNSTGRIIFTFLGVSTIVMIALGIMAIADGMPLWQLKVSVAFETVGLLVLIVASTSTTVFRFHRTNFLVFLLFTIALMVMELLIVSGKGGAASAEEKGGQALGHTSCIGSALVFMVAGVLLLIQPASNASKNIHPFIFSGKKRRASSPTEKKNGEVHREAHSVFEDWPEPVPFPVVTLYTFNTESQSELAFSKGQNLMIMDCRGNWWQARNSASGKIGFIPSNFVQVLQKARVVRRHLASSDDEASVQEGQVVEVMEHHEFLSLVRTVEGRIGSVPTAILQLVPDAALEKLKA